MNEWEIYPAIDLRGGRVVRLKQGDPAQETAYDNDPLVAARRWQGAGARWLHVVNLDGAFGEGSARNLTALERILSIEMDVQFGGGLRDLESIRRVLDLGVSRAIIGTAAVHDPAQVEAALSASGPERIAVAIDTRQGLVRTHGWQQDSAITAVELAQRCARQGISWIIHTDVGRDGMGRGLNVEASRTLARESKFAGSPVHVIASGGVASLEDVEGAYRAELSGAIIGRALYESAFRLEDALQVGRTGDAG